MGGGHLVEGRGVGARVTKGAPVGETSSVLIPTTAEPGNNLKKHVTKRVCSG